MPGSPQSDTSAFPDLPGNPGIEARAELSDTLQESELDAALQLLVERAQYITGATGTALALPQGNEMVCRASAGACAPAVGARLQVRSGLTGESISRRQLLRCDNAEADPRVNLETCRALGIASIVVLPLMRRNGEVRGLFELFSDHPYAFEERDLVALERMAALTMTALDLAEQRGDLVTPQATKQSKPTAVVSPPATKEAAKPHAPAQDSAREVVRTDAAELPIRISPEKPDQPPSVQSKGTVGPPPESQTAVAEPTVLNPPVAPEPVASSTALETSSSEPPAVPEAMRRIQKCASCGFPVSEGRKLCLDCESLEKSKVEAAKKAGEKTTLEETKNAVMPSSEANAVGIGTSGEQSSSGGAPAAVPAEDQSQASSGATPDEILPPFLTNPQLTTESWLASHVNLLAFVVLVLAVFVAAVVFFR